MFEFLQTKLCSDLEICKKSIRKCGNVGPGGKHGVVGDVGENLGDVGDVGENLGDVGDVGENLGDVRENLGLKLE